MDILILSDVSPKEKVAGETFPRPRPSLFKRIEGSPMKRTTDSGVAIGFALLLSAGAALSGTGSTAPPGNTVYADCELGVNYVVHVYTLARAGFRDDDYAVRFGDTIPAADLEFLQENAALISFLRQDSGPFAGACYFVPAGMNLDSREDYARYYSAWNRALEARTFAPLEALSDPGLENSRGLFALGDEDWRTKIVPLVPVFVRIGKIFTESFDAYAGRVWPSVKPILEERARVLNERLSPLDLIPSWEKATGYGFGDGGYCVSLFYAGKNGPSFNNTGLHKNTVYFGMEEARLLDMISHEVGIRVMMPRLQRLLQEFRRDVPKIESPHIYGNVGYMAFESLAAYYNRRVLGRAGSDIYCPNDPLAFLEIFGKLDGPGVSPENLFREGVREYIAGWTDAKAIEARFKTCSAK